MGWRLGVGSGNSGFEDELEEDGGSRVPLGFLQGDYSEPSDSGESD